MPIHLAFIDVHKAFNSIEKWTFLDAMDAARIDSRYTALIQNIYERATFDIKIDEDLKTNKIQMYRGVRQGDPISPKLFILVLKNVFEDLNWDDREINIDESYLNNLRFADDVILLSNNTSEPKDMMEQLNNATKKVD